jgi:hypothetical protein
MARARAAFHRDLVSAAGHHLKRIDAKKSIPPHVFSALHAFEEETVGVIGGSARRMWRELQVSGHRAQEIRHNGAIHGDDISSSCESLELSEAWLAGSHK